MRIFWIPLILVVVVTLVLDFVIYRKASKASNPRFKWLGVANAVASVAVLLAMVWAFMSMPGEQSDYVAHMNVVSRVMLAYFIVNVPKWLWGLFYGVGSIKGVKSTDVGFILRAAGAAMAMVSFIVLLQGTFITPYRIAVNEVELEFATLPQAFDGYRIVHISDAHLGTYGNDTSFINSVVETINDLDVDAVCFTGDLVSMTQQEAVPFRGVLSRLRAKDGVYSIMGNHDYAHYMPALDSEAQLQDEQQLRSLEQSLGWKLLCNEASVVRRGNDSIAIVGTENSGEPPFQGTGDYGKASQGLDGVFKVHMQHNPYMWRHELVGKAEAPLTLSGHTHAMQFVINLMGLRWSPASWRYSEWGGLYRQGTQMLYVNTGLGMVGPPMRVGVPPEVTVITLKKKSL